ncbi:hypothetical protein [Lysinibacillus sphaericus]|uniref:hypothetical protein n=1 Tax=Lysinibacillus sphaericus TaxID=1421 RepID=UPI0018CFA74A|nr:hypothetical protein [Lysinibacillus sphaericus]
MEQLSKPTLQKLLNRLVLMADYAESDRMLEGLSDEEVQALKVACSVMEEKINTL